MLLLDVPYSEKEEVKRLGGRWNPELKKWYVADRRYYPLFKKWILKGDYEKLVICDYIYLIESERICFKCGQKTRVIALGIEKYYRLVNYEKPLLSSFPEYEYLDKYTMNMICVCNLMDFMDVAPEGLIQYILQHYNYKKRFSNVTKDTDYANCCDHCDVLQGNYYLFEEVDSPFFLIDEEKAEKMKLYKISLKYDVVSDISVESYAPQPDENFLINKLGREIVLPIQV